MISCSLPRTLSNTLGNGHHLNFVLVRIKEQGAWQWVSSTQRHDLVPDLGERGVDSSLEWSDRDGIARPLRRLLPRQNRYQTTRIVRPRILAEGDVPG